MWPSGDPRVHVNGGAGGTRLDRDVLHQAPHEGDPPATMRGGASGGFHEPVSTTVTCNRSASAVARRYWCPRRRCAVAVLDGVGECLAGGDEHLRASDRDPPRPWSATRAVRHGWGEMARARRESRSRGCGLAVQQQGDVVLIAIRGREPGHDSHGRIIQPAVRGFPGPGRRRGRCPCPAVRDGARPDRRCRATESTAAAGSRACSGRDRSKDSPSGVARAPSSSSRVPSARTTIGGGWPALEYTSSPLSGLSTAQKAVVHRAPGSRAANWSRAVSAAPGRGVRAAVRDRHFAAVP